MILLNAVEFTLNAVYSMNSRGYIRLHSDTESAQNQTIVGNCLFFKHTPHFDEAVYRIYRQSPLPHRKKDCQQSMHSLLIDTVLNHSIDTVIIDSALKLSTVYPPQKRSPTKDGASVDNLVQL